MAALGKEAYRAPEACSREGEYDGFVAEAFAVGIVAFAALFVGPPWRSARGEAACPAFEHFRDRGFGDFTRRRRLPTGGCVADCISFAAQPLLEGLLDVDPSSRLTLGEAAWRSERGPRESVWDYEWLDDA